MEALLLIALFASNVVALECLYNQKIKTTGMLLIANMLLTVLIAYQFKQMKEIFSIIVCAAILIAIISKNIANITILFYNLFIFTKS